MVIIVLAIKRDDANVAVVRWKVISIRPDVSRGNNWREMLPVRLKVLSRKGANFAESN